MSGSDYKETSISKGKRVYLAAHELEQLRADLEMLQETDRDAPDAEIKRRNDIAEKLSRVSKREADPGHSENGADS